MIKRVGIGKFLDVPNSLLFTVRPYTTEVIDGNNGKPVLQDSLVTLMCRVDGARPAAVITWYNGTTPFNQQSAEHIALKVIYLNLF